MVAEDLPITPDLNVGAIVEMCCGWLGLKDPRVDSFGLFVYDLGPMEGADKTDALSGLVRSPRPLRAEEFLGDVVVQRAKQKRKFKFVLKKKIFLPQHNSRGTDPFYERLVFLQAEDDTIIQGVIDVDSEEKAIALAGMSMAIAFGEAMGYTSDDLVEANCQNFIVPKFRGMFNFICLIPCNPLYANGHYKLRPSVTAAKRTPTDWASFIFELREQLVKSDPQDLQDQFLQIVQTSPTYGVHWFYVYFNPANKVRGSSMSYSNNLCDNNDLVVLQIISKRFHVNSRYNYIFILCVGCTA